MNADTCIRCNADLARLENGRAVCPKCSQPLYVARPGVVAIIWSCFIGLILLFWWAAWAAA